jgi:hypothetical protein
LAAVNRADACDAIVPRLLFSGGKSAILNAHRLALGTSEMLEKATLK